MLNYSVQYDGKKYSPEQAVSLIQNDDAILATGGPGVLLDALFRAKERFDKLKLYTLLGLNGTTDKNLYAAEASGHIVVTSGILSVGEGSAWMDGTIDQAPIQLSTAEAYLDSTVKPTVLLAHCPPPDDEGYFYMGVDEGGFAIASRRFGKVIIQVNENLPRINSDARIHINRVTAICESNKTIPVSEIYTTTPDEADKAIAGYVAELVPQGATLQLGPGFLTDLAARYLVNHKDLGVHTDCFSDALVELIKKGAVNNSQKAVMKDVSVGSYFNTSAENLKFLDRNPAIMMKRLSWVCDPLVICQMKNMVAINQAIAVDFRGQFCCGSLGMDYSGGSGGELDFARGVKRGGQGKFIMVMRSTSKDKDGRLVSNIYPGLPEGSLVNVPRSEIMYIVTEYGVSNLRDLSVKERVQELKRLSHPEFRDWIQDEAVKNEFY